MLHSGSTDSAINLPPDDYKVTVFDSSGCLAEKVFSITSPAELQVFLLPTFASSDTVPDGSVESYVLGGQPPYSYLWSNSATTPAISSVLDSAYLLTVTDRNGCVSTERVRPPDLNPFGPRPYYRDCYSCFSLPNQTPCGVNIPTPCTACTTITKSITDFNGNGNDNDPDECAFEDAAAFFATIDPSIPKKLLIPYGTYWVGAQYQVSDPSIGEYHRFGTTVFCMSGIQNLTIQGELNNNNPEERPVIKFMNCMKYGVFDVEHNSDDRFLSGGGIFINCSITQNNPTISMASGNTNLLSEGFYLKGDHFAISPPSNGNFISQILNSNQFTIYPAPTCASGTYSIYVYCDISPYTFNSYSHVATVGDMFHLSDCKNINIKDLELDGNLPNAIIGGGYSEGIQLNYTGLFISSSRFVTLHNLYVHHFGWDGLYIIYPDCHRPAHMGVDVLLANRMNMLLDTCRFSWNGRNNVSWCGGIGLTCNSTEFSYSGQSRLTSSPGAGLDIEFENSTYPCASGIFNNCMFKYNKTRGLISDAQSNALYFCHDYFFSNCTFVGSESGVAVYPRARGMTFTDCNFFGKVWNLYSSRVHTRALSVSNIDNVRFIGCNFNEEYDNHYFSFRENEVVKQYALGPYFAGPCPSAHEYMLELSSTARVSFTNCWVQTNFTNKLIYMDYRLPTPLSQWNLNVMDNTTFINGSYNGCDCDPDLAIFTNVIVGNQSQLPTNVWYWPYFRNPGVGCPWPNGYVISFFSIAQNGALDPRYDPSSNIITNSFSPSSCALCDPNLRPRLLPKYLDPVDLETAMPLFANDNCVAQPAFFPTACSSSNNRYAIKTPDVTSKGTFEKELLVDPNPTNGRIIITNLPVGENLLIYDCIGNVVQEFRCTDSFCTLDLSALINGVYFIKADHYKVSKTIKM